MEKFINLIFFFTAYFFLFMSVIGWGKFFSKLLSINTKSVGLIGIHGIVFLTFFSYATIYLIPHNYIFNIILHLIGLIFLCNYLKNININKITLIIIVILFLSSLISKTHDDFPFYHLQQSLNFSVNKFQIGLANLDFSFAHHSSKLLLNSLFYLPFFGIYLFNLPNLILFTIIILFFLERIQNSDIKNRENLFSYLFLTFLTSYFLLKFSRLSEFGTDLAAQCLITILVYFFTNKEKLKNNLILIHLIFLFCITSKTYFFVYLIFYIYMLFCIGIKNYFQFLKKNLFLTIFLTLFFLIFLLTNFLTTGCLIYPISSLCFDNFLWSMGSQEVHSYNQWYEKWAKGIAGTGYILENSSERLNNFSWVKNWYSNYFQNKFLDNLATWLTMTFIFLIFFIKKNKKKFYYSNNIFLTLIIIIFIIIFWFIKHPTLRYGGYAPITLFFAITLSYYLSCFDLKKQNIYKIKKTSQIIIISSLTFFSLKNLNRIHFELKRNDEYKFVNFPYFYTPTVKYKKIMLEDNIVINQSINNNCWNTLPPCTTNSKNLRAKKILGYNVFYKINE